jgi:hypothetical protein
MNWVAKYSLHHALRRSLDPPKPEFFTGKWLGIPQFFYAFVNSSCIAIGFLCIQPLSRIADYHPVKLARGFGEKFKFAESALVLITDGFGTQSGTI